MDVAQVEGTNQLYSIKKWAALPAEQRPGPMVCPGRDDHGTLCTTEAIPCAYSPAPLRGEKSRRPYCRGKKHLVGCDEVIQRLPQKRRPVDYDETSLVSPRGTSVSVRITLTPTPEDSRVPTTPASARRPSGGSSSRSQVDPRRKSTPRKVNELLKLLSLPITEGDLTSDSTVAISDKNGQLVDGLARRVLTHVEDFSWQTDGTPMIIWGTIESIVQGNAGRQFINFDAPAVSIRLERNVIEQLTEKKRQSLVKGAYVIAVGIVETTRSGSHQLLRVTNAELLEARNLTA